MGGFGTIIASQGQGKDPAFQLQQGVLFWIIPAAGLVAAILGLVAILASIIRIRQFERSYAVYETHARPWDNSAEDFPTLQDQHMVKALTSVSLLGLPTLFILIWMIVFCLQVVQKLG